MIAEADCRVLATTLQSYRLNYSPDKETGCICATESREVVIYPVHLENEEGKRLLEKD